MQEKQVYEYAVIRYVPKVEREEFINIGVILYCRTNRYLDIKYHIDIKRLLAFDNSLEVDLLENYLKSWDLICRGDKNGGKIAELDQGSRFRWLTATRSTVIQSSKVHPGRCIEPEKVLENLFEKIVL